MKKILFGIVVIITMAAFYPAHLDKKPSVFSVHRREIEKTTLNGINYDEAQKMICSFEAHYTQDEGLKSATAWFNKDEICAMLKVLKQQTGIAGVRFHWGVRSSEGTKLQLKMLLITTKNKYPVPPSSNHNVSKYYDYPIQDSEIQKPLGQYWTNSADDVLKAGGVLYGDNRPNIPFKCKEVPEAHRMTRHSTYFWVQRRHDKPDGRLFSRRDKSCLNTKSEWFDICFIGKLFETIANTSNLDGMRVYLGKGGKFLKKKRDVFILVPTHVNGAKHDDDFSCLNLVNCTLCTSTALGLGEKKPDNTLYSIEELNKQFELKYFSSDNTYMTGGYNNGELCPTYCE